MQADVVCLKETLLSRKTFGIALDIDETLTNTIEYLMFKLNEFCGNPENLSAVELVNKYTYTWNVPYFQTPAAKEFLAKELHDDLLQEELPVRDDSNTVVGRLNFLAPVCLYLTGRPPIVLRGTRAWLDKHNFPDAPIITRPNVSTADVTNKNRHSWKIDVLNYLYPQVCGMVDDDPDFGLSASKSYKGIVWLYNSDKFVPGANIIFCKTWVDLEKSINKHFVEKK